MNNDILVSVIMPVYNTQKFVGEAIQSILSQTFTDFEFIILDDCSNDGSYEICQKFAEKDSRIKLFRNEKNMGISFCRNKLIELSKTNYIASQDSDDISEKNRLELCFDFLEKNPDFGVVSGNNLIINENGEKIGERKYLDEIKKIILKKSPVSQPSSMFKKDIFEKIGGYDKSLNLAEDYDLWIRFYQNGYKIKNLNHNLIKYRIRSGQSKSDKLKQTIKNTIFIQKRAIKNGMEASFGDRVYICLEQILLFLPNSFILFLFKLLEYRK